MRFAFIIPAAGLLLAACGENPSVEQQIIKTLHSMEAAAEGGRHFDFIDHVADSFGGQKGTMNRVDFHRFMVFQMNQNRRLYAQFFPIHVQETSGNQAAAQFRILVTGGGGLFPERGQLFEVETHWILDGDDWMLIKADWEAL